MKPPLLALLCASLAAPPTLAAAAGEASRDRPVLDGAALFHDTEDGLFRIHYTLDGGDALDELSGDDDPPNGVPDAVDVVAGGLGDGWGWFVDEQGWRPPGDDEGEGGDSRLDVYLRRIDHNGLASPEWHTDHWAAYLQVDPDLAAMTADLMASVAAHELFHAVEYSYTTEAHTWVDECSATYAQYQLYSDTVAVAAALQVLWGQRLADPGSGLDATGDRMEYAALIWPKYLVDRSGDPWVFQRWWDRLADTPDWRASLDQLAAAEFGEDALALVEEYGEWLAFACARDDGQHWADDDLECLLDIEAALDHDGTGLPATWQAAPAASGTSFARIELDDGGGAVAVTCTGGGAFSVRAVVLAAGDVSARASARAADGEATAEASVGADDDELLVVLTHWDGGEDGFECTAEYGAAPIEGDDDDGAHTDGCACSQGRPRRGAGLLAAVGIYGALRKRRGR